MEAAAALSTELFSDLIFLGKRYFLLGEEKLLPIFYRVFHLGLVEIITETLPMLTELHGSGEDPAFEAFGSRRGAQETMRTTEALRPEAGSTTTTDFDGRYSYVNESRSV